MVRHQKPRIHNASILRDVGDMPLMLHPHRYMSTSAEAIGVNAQFLYAPDCMLISFLVSATFHLHRDSLRMRNY